MSQRVLVILRVAIDPDWTEGTTLQAYADWGDGSIDTTKPLLQRRHKVFPGQPIPHNGLGLDPFDLLGVRPGPIIWNPPTFADEVLGETDFCQISPFVDVPVRVPQDYALWKFAVESYDDGGNVQQAGLSEVSAVVFGTEPMPLRSLSYRSYHAGNDQVTFTVVANTEAGAQ